jgi:hypothetical protein
MGVGCGPMSFHAFLLEELRRQNSECWMSHRILNSAFSSRASGQIQQAARYRRSSVFSGGFMSRGADQLPLLFRIGAEVHAGKAL